MYVCISPLRWGRLHRGTAGTYSWRMANTHTPPCMRHPVCCEVQPVKWTMGTWSLSHG